MLKFFNWKRRFFGLLYFLFTIIYRIPRVSILLRIYYCKKNVHSSSTVRRMGAICATCTFSRTSFPVSHSPFLSLESFLHFILNFFLSAVVSAYSYIYQETLRRLSLRLLIPVFSSHRIQDGTNERFKRCPQEHQQRWEMRQKTSSNTTVL